VIITIEAPHSTVKVTLRDGVVVRPDYPLHYTYKWPARKLAAYCTKKGWVINPNVVFTPDKT
jgi:hypothetical protein